MVNNKLQIRNSTVEFLIFTKQKNKNTIEVRVEDETVWLTQKLMGVLFEKGRSTITEHLQNLFETGELKESSSMSGFPTYCLFGDSEDRISMQAGASGMFLTMAWQQKGV